MTDKLDEVPGTDFGFRTVGILCDDDPWELENCPFPRLGGTHEMVSVVQRYGVTQVIRTEMPATPDEQHFFVEACDQLGVRLLVVANLPERWGRPLTFIDDDGMRFIGLREDKKATDVTPEVARDAPQPETAKISNRDRVIFDGGRTKGDLADYYQAIAPLMLPWAGEMEPPSSLRSLPPEGEAPPTDRRSRVRGGKLDRVGPARNRSKERFE